MKIHELFEELDRHREAIPIESLNVLMRQLDLSIDDVRDAVVFHPEHYHRTLLHLGPNYAALILCWRANQRSPIHDHRGSACSVRVLQGRAREVKFKRNADGMLMATGEFTYHENQVCGSYDADIHTLGSADPGADLVSLHVYTPPMTGYHVYSLDSPEVVVCSDEEVLAERRRRQSAGAMA